MHEIAVIALDGSIALDLGIPHEVFGGVLDEHERPYYRVRLCTIDGAPISTNAGFAASVDYDLAVVAEADTVIVLPGRSARESAHTGIDERLARAIHSANDRGARMMAICTGGFVLAALGLLDGKRATMYWRRSEEFRELFPKVTLDADVLFVDDGALTSAGVAAGIDLCLYVVAKDCGVAASNTVARRLVTSPTRAGGQAQFIEREQPSSAGDALSNVLTWAIHNLHRTITVPDLAREASMSERSFTRHFRARTGTSPNAWIMTERLALARELLESTDLYIDEIARLSGLGTATHLRGQFQRRLGQTPSAYRKVFRPALVE